MTFSPGTSVHLAGLGTGTIREVRSGGRYVVEIKGRIVIAAHRDLELATPRSKPPKNRASARGAPDAPSAPSAPGPCPSLDLHGKTVAEARDALEAFVNEALLENRAHVRVIHGRGGGRVKAAVHQYLHGVSAVASFRVDPQNPGVTVVTFA
ncbi:MAG TPA: Smr/MutS family protein [Vicinamibacterales bacterium]|nr:Smr/MutS family protein [Vicinamibacterales bacterium]